MSDRDMAVPIARFLGFPLPDPARQIAAQYGWVVEATEPVPGRPTAYYAKQVEFGGYVTAPSAGCACRVHVTIAAQQSATTSDAPPPKVSTTIGCGPIGRGTWDPKYACAPIQFPSVSPEEALVTLAAVRVEVDIPQDPANLRRLAGKILPLHTAIRAAAPKVGERLRWTQALKIHRAVPGKAPGLGAGAGSFVAGTNLLLMDDGGRRAGAVWRVKDAAGNEYLVFARDITRE